MCSMEKLDVVLFRPIIATQGIDRVTVAPLSGPGEKILMLPFILAAISLDSHIPKLF